MSEAKKKWHRVGQIAVDSGMCWVSDPCRVIHDNDEPESALGKGWHDFCRLAERGGIDGPRRAVQFDGDSGLGVCCRSGAGDGVYDVYVRRSSDGTVSELRVVFDTVDAENDDELC